MKKSSASKPKPHPTVALVGAFDTKGEEFEFLRGLIEKGGCRTLTINTGILGEPPFHPTISAEEVAIAGGSSLAQMRKKNDRGIAVTAMAKGIGPVIQDLHARGKIQGILAGGGGAGSSVASAAMSALPIGFPKVIVTTGAGLSSASVLRDTILFPTVVDVSGLNRISRPILTNAANAIAGMVKPSGIPDTQFQNDKPILVASMFGNTTKCVDRAREIFTKAGYEVLVFHATGTGGQAMEGLIRDGYARGVFDVTTTEWADECVGGILGAGPTRLDAAPHTRTPCILSTGCLDMVNFGAPGTVPAKFKGRRFYQHNPNVTLMRTTPKECAQIGKILAGKANQYVTNRQESQVRSQKAKALHPPIKVFIPLRGISVISAPGQPFYWPEADEALHRSLKKHLRPEIEVIELDCNINDPIFAETTVRSLMGMMK